MMATKTCRKHDTTCRFKYPRYPSPHTIIVRTCTGGTQEDIDANLAMYRRILTKVREVLEDEDQIKKIMEKYNKQEESKERYKKKIRSRIEQIQIVLDYFAVITYVTDYYSKDDTGTMEVIKAALQQSDAKDVKEKMRTVSSTFLTHRQMGEAEAVYMLLPSMTLKKSNVGCQWVSLGMKEERTSRWKRATKKEEESGRPLTKLMGHEGLWYEQQDMWSKYLRRPMDSLGEMCFAQFAKMFKSYGSTRSKEDKNEHVKENEVDEDDGYITDDADDKFNYVMTHRNDDKNKTKIPEYIILRDPYPGEPQMMQKRTFPAVLRFNKTNKGNNPQRYMLSELMLYRPTSTEIEIDEVEDLYGEMYNDKRKVDIVKNQVMEHLEGVEEARYYVEQAKKEIDLTEIGEKLDPALEQDNADCEEIELVEHPDLIHADPDQIATGEDGRAASIYRRIEIPNETKKKEKTRTLDSYQREVINIGIKYAKGIVKARKEGNASPTAPLLMVHGGAGAGKSTVIKVLAQWTQKILQQEGDNVDCPCVIKTAFTGTASSNIEGQTLHASFGFAFDNKHYSLSDKSRDQKRAALKNLKMVIIDEVSMVKADMQYQLDLRLQEITEKVGVPFGGLSIFAFGDMMQLKPCMGHFICDEPINNEFKITHAIKPRWAMFKSLILEFNHRQEDDKPYADLLSQSWTTGAS